MSKFLKGNYKVPEKTRPAAETPREGATEEFERRALERLGGSIAFVLKRNTFVWNGEPKDGGSAG